MDRDELLSQMRSDRQALTEILKHIPEGQMDAPVLHNQWSVKDVLGHLGFWERRAAALYYYFQGGPEPDPKPGTVVIEELNARVFAANRGLALTELVQTEEGAYQTLYHLAATAPEADLFDPQRFPPTDGSPFVNWISGNSYDHYRDHLPDLRAWLGLPGWISYHAEGKTLRAYTAHPAKKGPGIIVLHAWWGLNPFFQRLCDRLAQAGFVALAPDLNNGQVATSIEEAKELMETRDWDLVRIASTSAVDQIHRQPGLLSPGPLGVIGFSMGAAWSVVLSEARPADIAAAVLFYGTAKADFSQTQAAYLGHFAEQDEWAPQDGIRSMQSEMQAAGREASFYTYPGTGHWFFEDNRPDAFQLEAANLAWDRTLAFFKSNLD